jgi:hypothetical protein
MEQYKLEFDQIYAEYLESHNYLETVAKVFQAHKNEIEAIVDKASKEYNQKRDRIYKEYAEKLRDADYLKNKDTHDRLFNRLNFIQDLIKQYQSVAS